MATSTIFTNIALRNSEDIDNFLDAIEESEASKNNLTTETNQPIPSTDIIEKVVRAYE